MAAPLAATLEVPNDAVAIEGAQLQVVAAAEQAGYPKASLFAVRLALHEAISNAFVHGHKDCPDAPVRVGYNVGKDEMVITVEDQGPGFNPGSIPDPTLD